ncbi:MAG: hypothetical protein ACOZAO_00040 [Patescibacteria group bacterium]
MNIAFLFHLYQPITQDELVVRKVMEESYAPLLKLLKSKKNVKFTFNIPLSLVQQLNAYGYNEWISQVKELLEAGRLELVGSGAYHPLLSKLTAPLVTKEIILNEYGLGYYFGRDTDFEGDPSILVRDLNGFFPPELAINKKVLKQLKELSYSWVLLDESAIPTSFNGKDGTRYGVYLDKDTELLLAVRNRTLSNVLSFKRDLDTKNLHDVFTSSSIIALDGEFFGHHYKEGIYLLDIFLEELLDKKVQIISVGDYVYSERPVKLHDSILESSWAASDADMVEANAYPRWDVKGNEVHKNLWKIVKNLMSSYKDDSYKKIEGFEAKPIWQDSILSAINDSKLTLDIKMLQALHSDPFWWASSESVKVPWMIERGLELYKETARLLGDAELEKLVSDSCDIISKEI